MGDDEIVANRIVRDGGRICWAALSRTKLAEGGSVN